MTNQTSIVKLALIGCGRIAVAVHLRTFARIPGVEFVGLADTDARRLAEAQPLAPQAATFTDYRELLARTEAAAVIVAVPTALHGEIGLAVVEAGKHLYLEKPMASQPAAAERIMAVGRAKQTLGMVGFNYRFGPLQQEARRLLANHCVGDVLCVRSMFSDNGRELPGWLKTRETGGGALLELGSHHFDLIPHLLGSPIREVRATLRSQISEDDEAAVNYRLANGTLGQALFFFGSRQQDQIEIYGTKGRLVVDRFRSLRAEVTADPEPVGRFGRLRNTLQQIIRSPLLGDDIVAPFHEASYDGAFAHFVDAIRTGRQPSPSLADGYRSLAVVTAAEESARSGRPVSLDESPAS